MVRAQAPKTFGEYQYFFNDETPQFCVVSERSCFVTILTSKNTILFKGDCKAQQMRSFELPAVDKKEVLVKGDGHILLPIKVLSERAEGSGGEFFSDTLNIRVLIRKDNAVRIHFPSGLLETSLSTQKHHVKNEIRSLFFPFGFYARERDDFDWILRTEAMNGFNLYSPYQAIEDSTIHRRKAYMDLCADLGIRVNYNLQNICALKKSDKPEVIQEKLRKIQQEVKMFRDHPALLSWYVSDEPDGQFIEPGELQEAVSLIRKLDPYHPISMVFVDPKPSLPYQHLLDIAMTDPYPIPGNAVVNAGEYLQKLKDDYQYKKSIWIVPQAFGGQEFWSREPTPEELRSMVYLGVMHGARASQAFIRHVGQSFPKNPAMWAAYHQCARELQYLAKDMQYQHQVDAFSWKEQARQMKIDIASFMGENPHHQLFILANLENEHKILNLPMDSMYQSNGEWNFLFEGRKRKAGEIFELVLNPFEVKIIRFEKPMLSFNVLNEHEWKGNKIKDHSFEKWTAVGIPTACYLHMSKSHGATAMLDRNLAHQGEVSLRLNNLGGDQEHDQSQEISFYQFNTLANHSYVFSFWAYAEPSTSQNGIENKIALRIEKPWGKFIWKDTVDVLTGWNRYDIPYVPAESEDRNMLELRLLQKGFVWIDQVQWVESPTIELQGSIFDQQRNLKAHVVGDLFPLRDIHYTYFPLGADTVLTGNLSDEVVFPESGSCEVSYPLSNGIHQKMTLPVRLDYQRIPEVISLKEPSLKYLAGGKNALIDGELGEFVWDGKWQGFEGTDAEFQFSLAGVEPRQWIEVRCLSKKSAWVYWPDVVILQGSDNGLDFYPMDTIVAPAQKINDWDGVHSFRFAAGVSAPQGFKWPAFYRLTLKSQQLLPHDHPFVGEKSWLFIDEILVH